MVVARSDGAAAAGMDTPDDPVLLAKQSDWTKGSSQLFYLDTIRVKPEGTWGRWDGRVKTPSHGMSRTVI
ncbi:hypothetical protein IscW_ISCW022192 [Ixodes scapularis]|uniref:Uncharacterized protein n=1 Tax=Ixodes scapularis TaxID=6945 RepID=B7QDG9_IXOSC|nr:hypothetical protein IscW_ISCW022192 [Ixodes scapularis]|eukprot:XP_002413583.1 hypothetical protein IscW_ISCW022192 [Ixodes scapularis]